VSAAGRTAGAASVHPPRAARLAVSAIFFLNGAGIGNWVVRIPSVRDQLGLTEAALGVALLGVAAGALVAMPLAGRLVARHGSRPVTRAGAVAFAVALGLPALAPSLPLLCLALVVLGAGNGALDVAMNAQAAAVERRYARPIMSRFHALFSLGGLAGARWAAPRPTRASPPRRTSPWSPSSPASPRPGARPACSPPAPTPPPSTRPSRGRRVRWWRSASSPSACSSARGPWPTGAPSTCAT
jgi:hypothetical protein